MTCSMITISHFMTKPVNSASLKDEVNSGIYGFVADTNTPTQASDESAEQRARRVYGTKQQQTKKAASIIGGGVTVEPFTSCLVASDTKS